MLTRCPQCFAWFRVRAEQLSVANGLVTCGRCEQVFNALASLIEDATATSSPLPPRIEDLTPQPPAPATDKAPAVVEASPRATPLSFVSVVATSTISATSTPLRAQGVQPAMTTAATLAVSLGSASSSGGEPAVRASDDREDGLDTDFGGGETVLNSDDLLLQVDAHAAKIDVPPAPQPADSLAIGPMPRQLHELDIADFDFSADADEVDATPTADYARDQPPRVLRADHDQHDHHDDGDADGNTDANAHGVVAPQHSAARPQLDVPAVLLDDLAALESAPRPSAWRAVSWALFALVLVALAAVQLVFIERQPLLAWAPQAAPLIDALCARLPCLERREAASSVRLLARDVREHPSYRDALLVNATIVNDAKTSSPYPVIDLRLRDAAGNVLSARQFQPSEYLDQSIDLAAGMPSARPVYIVLELAGNASNAVSFEFTFM